MERCMWGIQDDFKDKKRFNKRNRETFTFQICIENTYNFIFTIKTTGANERIKSFTYSDILTLNLEILDFQDKN